MKKFDVLAIGELNVDLIVTGLKSMPVLGREIIAESSSLVLGSSTAICASGVARLGLKTGFVSRVGNDMFGKVALDGLVKNQVNTDNVIIDDTLETGITIALNLNKDRALVTSMGAIDDVTLEDVDVELLKQTRHIHVGSFFLQHKLRPDLPKLFSMAHEHGVTTSLDAGWDDSENWDYGIFETLEHTDIFFPNEIEALNISKKDSVREAVDELSKYARIVAVKCGPKGAAGKWGDKYLEKETFDLEPIDTTGAGDSFNAGFIYAFLKGYDLHKCLDYGNACGSISVTRVGGASSCATLEEVEDLIKNGVR